MAGDYVRYRQTYQAFDANISATTSADASTTAGTAAVTVTANETAYVQRMMVSVTVDAAQPLTFQDRATTPLVIGKTKASPGLGPILFDFGSAGIALTEGKNLDISTTGASLLGALIHIEGYRKKTKTTNA